MQHFIISGKAKNVFPLIALKAKREKELDLMMKRGNYINEDKIGVLPLESLFTQIPTQTQPHEVKSRVCPCNPDIKKCRVMENSLCAGVECEIWKKYEGE